MISKRLPGVNEHTKIIYLANPNNPTGTIFTRQQFEAFYKHIPERVLIILDEATSSTRNTILAIRIRCITVWTTSSRFARFPRSTG